MVVRIRLGRGTPLPGRASGNSRIARLGATLLTIVSISAGSFGVWRIGVDLGWSGDFVFTSGIFSHWQVWIAGACAAQYCGWRLARYARRAAQSKRDAEAHSETAAGLPVVSNV